MELGILRNGLPDDNIPSISNKTGSILRSYQDRFEGLGKRKDFQLRLYIDENCKPVVQTARKNTIQNVRKV